MNRRDELKLKIMTYLDEEPRTLPRLAFLFDTTTATLGQVLGELERDGYVEASQAGYTKEGESSTTWNVYRPTSERSLSDLRARLGAYRDPVREAHARDSAQLARPTKLSKDGSADLDSES